MPCLLLKANEFDFEGRWIVSLQDNKRTLVGLPVIASNCASLPEVAGADAAIFCAPDDPAAWTAAMLGLDQNPETASRLISAGLDRANHYSWNSTAKTVLELIESLPLASALQTR